MTNNYVMLANTAIYAHQIRTQITTLLPVVEHAYAAYKSTSNAIFPVALSAFKLTTIESALKPYHPKIDADQLTLIFNIMQHLYQTLADENDIDIQITNLPLKVIRNEFKQAHNNATKFINNLRQNTIQNDGDLHLAIKNLADNTVAFRHYYDEQLLPYKSFSLKDPDINTNANTEINSQNHVNVDTEPDTENVDTIKTNDTDINDTDSNGVPL